MKHLARYFPPSDINSFCENNWGKQAKNTSLKFSPYGGKDAKKSGEKSTNPGEFAIKFGPIGKIIAKKAQTSRETSALPQDLEICGK